MWLFLAKPHLNAKNVINVHRLYVLYDALCPCNQCFRAKVPFYHIYLTVSHNTTLGTKAHPFSPNQLTKLGFHMQVPILMIMAYVIGIHREKMPMNLVLISHKYSQRNTNLEITFCQMWKLVFIAIRRLPN